MNVMVIGGGHLGREIALELDSNGHDVIVVEENHDKLSLLDGKFGGTTITSFPMDIENLRNAGIESCDAVAVVTSDDNLNIAVSQIAQNIFHIDNVVSRITDPLREDIFNDFGLRTVCPTNMGKDSIITALMDPKESQILKFGTSTVTFRIRNPEKKDLHRFLPQLTGEKGEYVFGLIRESGKFCMNFPMSSEIVSETDFLVYACETD
ncbi:MAG: TrkA family potassium uptake protein [Clostridia bacterium]|nr:TrkA family potassium uptake protein [Clostridia bacterium]